MSKLLIELEIPLMSKEKLNLYKILPTAIPQIVFLIDKK